MYFGRRPPENEGQDPLWSHASVGFTALPEITAMAGLTPERADNPRRLRLPPEEYQR
jgi:hypothetical protein